MRYAVAGCVVAAALLYATADHRVWAVVAAAGVVGILATRTWGRAVVGAALLAAGLVAATDSVAGGALLAAAGAWTALRGRRWRALGARYDAPAAPREADLWTALDRGEDPTA